MREIVEFDGLRSYFFPNLILYANYNRELLSSNPQTANRFISFIFNTSTVFPNDQHLLDVIFPEKADGVALSTGIDACLALGGKFLDHAQSFAKTLTRSGETHDIIDAKGDIKDSSQPSCMINKNKRVSDDFRIRRILLKIIKATDETEKFSLITDLCALELDLDAYILIKILNMENENTADEVSMIRENIISSLDLVNPLLAELMKNGFKEKTIQLSSTSDSPVIQIHCHSIDMLAKNTDLASFIEKSRISNHVIFLIVENLVKNKFNGSQTFYSIIRTVRDDLFPGLQFCVLEHVIDFVHDWIQLFLKGKVFFENWTIIGIRDELECCWKKLAAISLIKRFIFAVETHTSSLLPMGDHVKTALRCAVWVLENSGNELNEAAKKELFFLRDSDERSSLIERMDFIKKTSMIEENANVPKHSEQTKKSDETIGKEIGDLDEQKLFLFSNSPTEESLEKSPQNLREQVITPISTISTDCDITYTPSVVDEETLHFVEDPGKEPTEIWELKTPLPLPENCYLHIIESPLKSSTPIPMPPQKEPTTKIVNSMKPSPIKIEIGNMDDTTRANTPFFKCSGFSAASFAHKFGKCSPSHVSEKRFFGGNAEGRVRSREFRGDSRNSFYGSYQF